MKRIAYTADEAKALGVPHMVGYDGNGIEIGDRVELHPGCDLWMRGARFGVVIGSSLSHGDRVRVRLDKLPSRVIACSEENVRFIASAASL